MKKLRLHQSELFKRAEQIVNGTIVSKTTVAHSVPGAGKSSGASIYAHALIKGQHINRVVWVCPRSSLAQQAADGFKIPELGMNYTIRKADNIAPLFRDVSNGCAGYVTTYQSVAANPELHVNSTKHTKYLLILDEPHHLQDESDGAWVKALEPLVENATHTLLMTGTIERHDKKLIPFIEYIEEEDSYFPVKDIIYSRFDALLEEAVVPIEFIYERGWVKFEDEFGVHELNISNATDSETSRVIQTFLDKTDFRDKLLRRGVNHWIETRKIYPSRAIVICATQQMAKDITVQLKDEFKIKASLAISEDSSSQETIKDFRKGIGQVLVTVGMAYEGLDVPDCKHLICLTNTRSVPWLEQAFARVTRVDYTAIKNNYPYNKQKAYIFVPDDPRMQRVVYTISEEQDRGIKVKKQKELEAKENAERSEQIIKFTPLGAGSTGTNTTSLQLEQLQEMNVAIATPDEQEQRKMIEMMSRRRDIIKRLPRGTTNKLLFRQFKKSRSQMSGRELSVVLNYINSLLGRNK